MKRKIIRIDEEKCTGCGLCIPNCHEQAIRIINGKARLVNDVFCDGLGACLGECPEGALTLEERDAEPFDETLIPAAVNAPQENSQQSELSHWPIQLHLLNPVADYFAGSDVVLAADCVAYSLANFHSRFLKGKVLAIACPKLDHDIEVYTEKIRKMADDAKINTLTVIMMQVPCCRGLLQIAQEALQKTARKVPLKAIIISTQGEVLSKEWV